MSSMNFAASRVHGTQILRDRDLATTNTLKEDKPPMEAHSRAISTTNSLFNWQGDMPCAITILLCHFLNIHLGELRGKLSDIVVYHSELMIHWIDIRNVQHSIG